MAREIERDYENDVIISNPQYQRLLEAVNQKLRYESNVRSQSLGVFLLEFLEEFIRAKEARMGFDVSYMDEALAHFNELYLDYAVINSFYSVMEYAMYYNQFEIAMLSNVFVHILDVAAHAGIISDEQVRIEDKRIDDRTITALIQRASVQAKEEQNEEKDLLNFMLVAQRRNDQIARREARRQENIRSIHAYITAQIRPVTKENLKRNYGHCTKEVLQKVIEKGGILDYQDRFMSIQNLRLNTLGLKRLVSSIAELFEGYGDVLHIDQVMEETRYILRDIYDDCFVDNSRKLFGLLKGIAAQEFSYQYPYIARNIISIEAPEIRLRNYVFQYDEISIDRIVTYAKEKFIKFNGMLDFFNSLNEKMLLKNRESLIDINNIGLTEEDVLEIEELICEELEEREFCAIRELQCVGEFPYCKVPYDEWLIYSLLLKWGSKIILQTTPGQFKYSLPVVSIYEEVSKWDLQDIAERFAGNINLVITNKVDDLDNLDELLGDLIDIEDIEDFEEDDYDDFEDLDLDDLDDYDDLEDV